MTKKVLVIDHTTGIGLAWWQGPRKVSRCPDWHWAYSTIQGIEPNYPVPAIRHEVIVGPANIQIFRKEVGFPTCVAFWINERTPRPWQWNGPAYLVY